MKSLSSNKKHEKGQGLVEYALILVLVSIVVIGGMTVLGPSIGNVFSGINNSITTAGGGGGDSVAAATAVPTTAPIACNTTEKAYEAARVARNNCLFDRWYNPSISCESQEATLQAASQTRQSSCGY